MMRVCVRELNRHLRRVFCLRRYNWRRQGGPVRIKAEGKHIIILLAAIREPSCCCYLPIEILVFIILPFMVAFLLLNPPCLLLVVVRHWKKQLSNEIERA